MRFTFPQFLYDDEDGTGTGEPVVAPAAVTEPAPVVPAPQPGPWDADLGAFEDPAIRAQVDTFLREKIQPRVTQFEMESSQYKPARELYDDLLQDPNSTLSAVVAQLYGDDVATAIHGLLPDPAAEYEPAETPTASLDQYPPELQELLLEREQSKAKSAYDAELARVKEVIPDLVEDEFHPFVVSAQGNMDNAVTAYQGWRAGVIERYGPRPTEEAPAPPALGLEGVNGSFPKTEKYDSFDAALDAHLAEQRASREVAPVGTV